MRGVLALVFALVIAAATLWAASVRAEPVVAPAIAVVFSTLSPV